MRMTDKKKVKAQVPETSREALSKTIENLTVSNAALEAQNKDLRINMDRHAFNAAVLLEQRDSLEAECKRLNKMRTHCEKCGADYMATGIETGCPCLLKAENAALRALLLDLKW